MIEISLRWGGASLIAGAALLGTAIAVLSLNPVVNQPLSPRTSLLLLASVFLLLSLPAIYARQANAAGWLGIAGQILLQTGMLLLVIVAATPLLYPSFNSSPGESPVVFLFGIATLRADVFPRGAGILLLVATVGFFFVFFVAEFLPPLAGQVGSALFGILLALALAWIGIALWAGKLGPATSN